MTITEIPLMRRMKVTCVKLLKSIGMTPSVARKSLEKRAMIRPTGVWSSHRDVELRTDLTSRSWRFRPARTQPSQYTAMPMV